MTHHIEDDISEQELDAIEALWAQKELELRGLLFDTIIAHHELDKLRGTDTAMAHAERNGLKSEFEQYLTETEKELK